MSNDSRIGERNAGQPPGDTRVVHDDTPRESQEWTGRRIIRTIYAVIGGGVAGFVIPIVCCVLLGYLLIWLQIGEGLVVMLSFLPIMLSPCGGVIGMVVGLQRINQSYRER